MFSLPMGQTDVTCLQSYINKLIEKNEKHLCCQYFIFRCENQSFADMGFVFFRADVWCRTLSQEVDHAQLCVIGIRARATTVLLLQPYWKKFW